MTGQPTLFREEQHQPTKDDYYTPAWIFDGLGLEFDLDVAAPPGGVPWIPTKRYFTMADDGLAQSWNGLVWCNPPFSNAGAWARKWATHPDGVLLVCVSKATWLSDVLSLSDYAWISRRAIEFSSPLDGTADAKYIPWQLVIAGRGAGSAGVKRLAGQHLGVLLEVANG